MAGVSERRGLHQMRMAFSRSLRDIKRAAGVLLYGNAALFYVQSSKVFVLAPRNRHVTSRVGFQTAPKRLLSFVEGFVDLS